MTDIIPLEVKFDSLGHIVSVDLTKGMQETMTHSDNPLERLLEDDELQHFGVAGMKWGTRRGGVGARIAGAHTDRNSREIARNQRVADGKGSVVDKVRILSKINVGKLLTQGGLKGVAQVRVNKLKDQNDRLATGKATVLDKLKVANNLRVSELVTQRIS